MEDRAEAVAEAGKNESTVKLCRRCKNPYYSASNTPCSCRFHPSFFVCRRHDDQKRSGHVSRLMISASFINSAAGIKTASFFGKAFSFYEKYSMRSSFRLRICRTTGLSGVAPVGDFPIYIEELE